MKKIIKSLQEVFIRPLYGLVALLSSILIGAIMTWISSYDVIKLAIISEAINFAGKLKLIFSSLGSFVTNFTVSSQVMVVLVSLLAGVNMAMLIFYLRKSRAIRKTAKTSVLGLIVGTLGVGCSACGSVILSSIFGISASFVFMSYLPLRGMEFGLIGIGLVILSIYNIANKMQSPATCSIKK
jgi:small-conductance mechanosensitive channel